MEFRPGKLRLTKPTGYCALPIGGDTYKNCVNGCTYCYERQTHNQHLRKEGVAPVDHKMLFNSIYDDPEVREFVVNRKCPVTIGVCSDPFPPQEREYRITERFLEMLASAGMQVQLTTKRPDNIDEGHIGALKKCDKAMVRVSFSTLNDEAVKKLEPIAPRPSARLAHMRRLADAGIEIGGRLSPFLYTQDYDYSLLAEAGCSNVTVELFRFSAVWRHSFPIEFWEAVSGKEAPPGDMADKNSPRRKWAERVERAFFKPLQDLKKHPYHSDGTHWIYVDIHKLRALWQREKAKAEAAGLKFGLCSTGSGIHNIDLNDAPCGCLTPGWRYDNGALVPAFFEDGWKRYIVPALWDYSADVAIERFIIANSGFYRPLVFNASEQEQQAAICDAPVHLPDEMR